MMIARPWLVTGFPALLLTVQTAHAQPISPRLSISPRCPPPRVSVPVLPQRFMDSKSRFESTTSDVMKTSPANGQVQRKKS